MGRLFIDRLDGRVFSCRECASKGVSIPLARVADVLSRSFYARSGPAYLMDSATNVQSGSPEEREMTTGRHVVRDLHCTACLSPLGWLYDLAYNASEKYKASKIVDEQEPFNWEGKCVLEVARVMEMEASCLPRLSHSLPNSTGFSGSELEDAYEV